MSHFIINLVTFYNSAQSNLYVVALCNKLWNFIKTCNWSFKRQPHKWVKHTQTTRRQKPTTCLSVFDHFLGLMLTGLRAMQIWLLFLMAWLLIDPLHWDSQPLSSIRNFMIGLFLDPGFYFYTLFHFSKLDHDVHATHSSNNTTTTTTHSHTNMTTFTLTICYHRTRKNIIPTYTQ